MRTVLVLMAGDLFWKSYGISGLWAVTNKVPSPHGIKMEMDFYREKEPARVTFRSLIDTNCMYKNTFRSF